MEPMEPIPYPIQTLLPSPPDAITLIASTLNTTKVPLRWCFGVIIYLDSLLPFNARYCFTGKPQEDPAIPLSRFEQRGGIPSCLLDLAPHALVQTP